MNLAIRIYILILFVALQLPLSQGFAEINKINQANDTSPQQPTSLQTSSLKTVLQDEHIAPSDSAPLTPSSPQKQKPFEAFTGKVTKNKVRLRGQPNLESPVLKEMQQGDLIVVVGETDDFFAVYPPVDIKAYVFRTYVLDNVVEANRVNVRLEPDMDAPTIAQLKTGDVVNGVISTRNNKWLEISMPDSSRFYISKDYVKKIGDAGLMQIIEQKRTEVNCLLHSTNVSSQQEIQKPFPEINLEPIYANYNKIISSYSDFPEQVNRAKEQVKVLQEGYLQKKLLFLEDKSKIAYSDWQTKNVQLNEQLKIQQEKLSQYEQQLKNAPACHPILNPSFANLINKKMKAWLPIEENLFNQWQAEHGPATLSDFYNAQLNEHLTLTGIIEPYTRVVRNKPGDYVVVNPETHLPIAFVYSTTINLQEKVGHHVRLTVSMRNNNNFAYPAFFVLSAELE